MKKKSKKKKSKKDGDDKVTTKAKSKAKKDNPIQTLTQSVKEDQAKMLDMATEPEWRVQRPPEAIQKQFEEQQNQTSGNDKDMPEPLLEVTQWKALLESNKKASSLSPTPVKAGLFTAACEKIEATPHQGRSCNQHRQPQLRR